MTVNKRAKGPNKKGQIPMDKAWPKVERFAMELYLASRKKANPDFDVKIGYMWRGVPDDVRADYREQARWAVWVLTHIDLKTVQLAIDEVMGL